MKINNLEYKILFNIVKFLKKEEYQTIQYFPPKFNIFALIKEFENIQNLFFRKKHLLFYYSIFPKFYYFLLNKRIRNFLKVFYFNKLIKKEEIIKFIPKKHIKGALKFKIISKEKKNFRFNLSFIPYKNNIFLRDSHDSYTKFFDPKKIKNKKIWMGADSIMFLRFINKYLKKNSFNSVLEIGSGSGIVIGSISKNFEKCYAVDLNPKAVKLTSLNAKLNLIDNLQCLKSDLFQKVRNKFDLIISNPWFVDLKKGGLEQAPKIIEKLKKYLNKNGRCLLIMNSYKKNGKDTLEKYFINFLKKNNFDVNLYTNGISYEFNRELDYKKNNIEYMISYNVEIITNGNGTLTKYDAPIARKIRDNFLKIFLYIYNIF